MINPPARTSPGDPDHPLSSTEKKILDLRRRLIREGQVAISMLETALEALWTLDIDKARSVRVKDDAVDLEEVDIERECYELLALHHPFARDFRIVTFILKVNADLERTADHACSIAKAVSRIGKLRAGKGVPNWPTALTDLGARVPAMCHDLMRAVMDEDAAAARRVVESDETIDALERKLFEEIMDMSRSESADPDAVAVAMLVYRVGRELERIGDIMKDVAEEVVYLATGAIIRHERRRAAGSQGG